MQSHQKPRYLVGIDLGTTHTVVAYADLAEGVHPSIEIFNIEQLTAPGEITARPLLPSVRYHPAAGELAMADTRLPWGQVENAPILGELARVLGAKTKGRLVTSAKSWLSHAAVDRTAAILPWGGDEAIAKVSPIEASASYLSHVRSAWNNRFGEYPLENQEIVITVPASFDEAARALTLEASHLAGLQDIRLVEEPQAAFYDWIFSHEIAKELADVRLLLVIDVGGGTCDFTLIQVEAGETEPKLTRIAVGNHTMLGGDNIDLTLAHLIEKRMASENQKFSAAELSQLVEQCRIAKEKLLAKDAPDSMPITLLGSGSKLIAQARSVELSRQEALEMVLDGFFPAIRLDELVDKKRSGIVEFGLPYASDPAISKHISSFLSQHHSAIQQAMGEAAMPDAVLLNGGVFNSPLIESRLLELLASWRGTPLKQLKNDRPDLAVAHGAVAYGLARHDASVQKIGGGSARSYFLLIDTDQNRQGICLLPKGSEEGQDIFLQARSFELKLGQPVRFHLLSSTQDTVYQAGDLVSLEDESFMPLPPLAVVFDQEQQAMQVEVQLVASLTELGTLKINCVAKNDASRRWNVEFQLRQGSARPEAAGSHPRLNEACQLITEVYAKKTKEFDPKKVKNLRFDLEKCLGKREDWESPLLRELFTVLLESMPRRRRSEAHERLWLSLAGYCLRPGFGFPLDDWRVEQIWNGYDQGIQFVNETRNWAEWWTLWRRIAGGLSGEAQQKIFENLADFINPETAKRPNIMALSKKQSHEDMVRLLAVLERLPIQNKTDLGSWLLQRLQRHADSLEISWALGRVGARVPSYAGIQSVIPRETASHWLVQLKLFDWKKNPNIAFAAALISRMSADRERDIEPGLRAQIIEALKASKSPESWIDMVAAFRELDEADEKRIFGEALPPGLKLIA